MTFFGTATHPEPGDLFVCSAGGGVGVAIMAGQLLDGDPIREAAWFLTGRKVPAPGVRPPWQYEHAGVYVGGRYIVQATPSGAERVPVTGSWDLGRRYVLWSTGLMPDLTAAQRANIADAANWAADHHIGYSVLDYLALAEHRLGVNSDELRLYIESSGHMICSQLCDWCYQHGPYQLFDNGRWNGYVTPADLAGNFIDRATALKLLTPLPAEARRRRAQAAHRRQPAA